MNLRRTTFLIGILVLAASCKQEDFLKDESDSNKGPELEKIYLGSLGFIPEIGTLPVNLTLHPAGQEPIRLHRLHFDLQTGEILHEGHRQTQTDVETCRLSIPATQPQAGRLQAALKELSLCQYQYQPGLACLAVLPPFMGSEALIFEGEGKKITLSNPYCVDTISACSWEELYALSSPFVWVLDDEAPFECEPYQTQNPI